jgi:hypothetical protein
MRLLTRPGVIVLLLVAAGIYVATHAPEGPRSLYQFEAERLASLELETWQASHDRERLRLVRAMVVLLRERYNYSWTTALQEAIHLLDASATFAAARGNYAVVLPDLEAAYTTARDWTGAEYDPAAVARAELAWWVAGRTEGSDSPAHVGDLIAIHYGLLYETTPGSVSRAAQLRAQAAALRDTQDEAPDWDEISRLLTESYDALHAAVGETP